MIPGDDSQETPVLMVAPAGPAAHVGVLQRLSLSYKTYRSLWLGEVRFANLAEKDKPPMVRLVAANPVSGQWYRWLHSFEPSEELCYLPKEEPHGNSGVALGMILRQFRPDLISPLSQFIDFDSTKAGNHLEEDLNLIATTYRSRKLTSAEDWNQPPRPINVNHEINNDLVIITMGTQIIIKTASSRRTNDEVISRMLVNIGKVRATTLPYLRILERTYPDDELLKQARQTLTDVSPEWFFAGQLEDRLNQLSNLKEVFQFVATPDPDGVREIPLRRKD